MTLRDARLEPRPIQDRLPVWIGGAGERRTAAVAARHADGCVPFASPDVLAHKRAVLDDYWGCGPRPGALSSSGST